MTQRKGQAMLIATLTLGGAILGATSLAGLLMLYQIRSTTDSADSAKAIFAADTGVNWALYDYFEVGGTPLPTLSDGATIEVTCYDGNGNNLGNWSCNDATNAPATTSYAIAEGTAGGGRRAFQVYLATATGTVP